MKKSLVVLMAVAMTFAFAAATVAADLSWWFGGEMYYYFDSNEQGLLESPSTFMVGNGLQVKATSGNTWAQAWMDLTKWRAAGANVTKINHTQLDDDGENVTIASNVGMWRFAFGANKIGDVLDLGFSTKDTGIATIGQVAITSTFNSYHADPVLNTFDLIWGLNGVLTLGNVSIKAEYCAAPKDTFSWEYMKHNSNPGLIDSSRGLYAVALVTKIDSGEIHFGYKDMPNNDNYLALLGGTFAIGDASLKVDLWRDKGGVGNYSNDDDDINVVSPTGTGFQADLGIGKFGATLFVFNPSAANVDNELGLGLSYRAMDKLKLAATIITENNDTNTNAWEAYGLYNVGAFDVKFGAMNTGREMDVAPWMMDTEDETSFILGFHAALW